MSTSPVPIARSASPDVVDLSSAREARQAPSAAWVCPVCDLVAGHFTPTECAFLADVHDQIQHGARPTARVVDVASLDAAEAGFGIGA